MDETIGQRIRRLRKAKGWNLDELARQMARHYGEGKEPLTGEAIRLYESGRSDLPRDQRRAMALAFGKDEIYLEFGPQPTHQPAPGVHEPATDYQLTEAGHAQNAREEIVLHLYRGLFPEQHVKLLQNLRAAFDSNNVTRKYLGNKPLTGVSDVRVRAAFGDAPFHTLRGRAAKGKKAERDPGGAMGDFLDDVE